MRFTTASGAVYDLLDVEPVPNEYGGFQCVIVRDCAIPIVDLHTGGDMPELVGQRAWFATPPVVGERFNYTTMSHGRCLSTPVVSVEEVA